MRHEASVTVRSHPMAHGRACRPTSLESNASWKNCDNEGQKVDASRARREERCRDSVSRQPFLSTLNEAEGWRNKSHSRRRHAASEPHGTARAAISRQFREWMLLRSAVSRPNYSGGVCRNIRRTREGSGEGGMEGRMP